MQLEITVLAFQEYDVYNIDSGQCMGALHFTHRIRMDCVWVQAGTKDMYGGLRCRLPAKLVALVKISE